MLVYTVDKKLRILDLHGSSSTEIVVNIRLLLDDSIPGSKNTKKYKFRPVHFADGYLSCRYYRSKPTPQAWLLVFDIHDPSAARVVQQIDSAAKMFVRNNRDYLYYGTHSEVGEDGFRRWALRGYCFDRGTWFDGKIHLPDLVGSDIGSTLCFEILGSWFYGLSSQTTFEPEGMDWTSYYHCFRFPLDRPRPECTQMPSKPSLWRRKHASGPIDDRWSFIRLERNEASGAICVVEGRKEWLSGSSSAQRTYYTQEFDFPPSTRPLAGDASTSTASSSAYGGQSGHSDGYSGTPAGAAYAAHTQSIHHGDDSSSMVMFTLSQTIIRSYHSTCSTFLDLVDDPSTTNPNDQRVRIRVGTRNPPFASEQRGAPHRPQDRGGLDGTNQVAIWPPEQDANQHDPRFDELYSVLNPPSHWGDLEGTWDERSLLYATGSGDADLSKALVFISFDPSTRLLGSRSWREAAAASSVPEEPPRPPSPEPGETAPQGGPAGDQDNKGDTSKSAAGHGQHSSTEAAGGHPALAQGMEADPSWIWHERAFCGVMSRGFFELPEN